MIPRTEMSDDRNERSFLSKHPFVDENEDLAYTKEGYTSALLLFHWIMLVGQHREKTR